MSNNIFWIIIGVAVLAAIIAVGVYFYNKNKGPRAYYAYPPQQNVTYDVQPANTYVVDDTAPYSYVDVRGYRSPGRAVRR
jgi:hypothetical protein